MHEVIVFTLFLNFVILSFSCIHLVFLNLVFLHFQYATVDMAGIELDPLWCKHEVNVTIIFIAPILEDLSQIEL